MQLRAGKISAGRMLREIAAIHLLRILCLVILTMVPFKVVPNRHDQHVSVKFPVYGGPNSLVIRTRNDFGLVVSNDLPPLGSASRGLRVLSESWNSAKTQLILDLSGRAGFRYQLGVWNPGQISSIEGGNFAKSGKLEITMPGGDAESYVSQKLVIHFGQ